MAGKEYECKDCERAFRVTDEEQKELKCPSCESENVAPKKQRPLPDWMLKARGGSS